MTFDFVSKFSGDLTKSGRFFLCFSDSRICVCKRSLNVEFYKLLSYVGGWGGGGEWGGGERGYLGVTVGDLRTSEKILTTPLQTLQSQPLSFN